MAKGDIQTYGNGFTMTCVGDYWNWPWWKRLLSTLVYVPYGWYRVEQGRWSWHQIPVESTTRRMGRDMYLETVKSLAHSHIKPVFWQLEHLEAPHE